MWLPGDCMRRRALLTVVGGVVIAGCVSDDLDEVEAATDETNSRSDEADDELEDEEVADLDEEDTDEAGQNIDEPDVQEFSGSGAEVIDGVEIAGGLTSVDATHDGESNFIVEFVPSDGEFNELLMNAIGTYEGTGARLLEEDTYQIDVDADGDWELIVQQPRADSGDDLPQTIEGDGPDLFGPFEFDGNHTAGGSYQGESNFIVEVYPPEGDFGELVFNEIGEFEGETTFRHEGVGFVLVEAEGTFTIELE